MTPTINTPYVKQFDNNGKLLNPISEIYKTEGENRMDRRYKQDRFTNNKKHYPLTVLKTLKFTRFIQVVPMKFNHSTGEVISEQREILHYLTK